MSLAKQPTLDAATNPPADATSRVAEAYDAHGRAVFNVCLRMTGRASIAEELTQETFTRLLARGGFLDDPDHTRAWLLRTGSNLAISRSRRRRVWSRIRSLLGTDEEGRDDSDAAEASEVQAALMQLPEGYRAVLILHDVAGMTHREIADARGCAPGTAKSQLVRARARLAALLEGKK